MVRRTGWALGAALAVLACGGGGGGGGSTGLGESEPGPLDPEQDFYLEALSLARPVPGPDGLLDPGVPLVHPASLLPIDGLTGLPRLDELAPLTEDVVLDELVPVALDQLLDPLTPVVPVVPRNGALVLSFSRPVDAEHLLAWDQAPADGPTPAGAPPLRVLDGSGAAQPLRALPVPGRPELVAVLGVTGQTVGWPATPLLFDPQGQAVQPPGGSLGLIVDDVRAADGTAYSPRPDLLASPDLPLPFDPGNGGLDAVVLQTDQGVVRFNGFLPDLTPPRLVRAVRAEGTLEAADPGSITDADPAVLPASLAQGGLGEWAGARLTIETPLAGGELLISQHRIDWHADDGQAVRFHLAPDELLDPRVGPGDVYRLVRSEAFEPIPLQPGLSAAALAPLTVDPLHRPRDPADPQDLLNSDLRRFVRVFDEQGAERLDVWDPDTGLFAPLPPRSVLELAFDEPLDPASLGAYESLCVVDGAVPPGDPGWQSMRVGRTTLSDDGLRARFEPVLEDQADPDGDRFVGFGGTDRQHRLVLRSPADPLLLADLLEQLSPAELAAQPDLEALRPRGLTDLAGRGLGLPAALTDLSQPGLVLLSPESPVAGALPLVPELSLAFETLPSDDPDHGVVVHRFLGTAVTGQMTYPDGAVHDTVTAGVEYADLPPLDEDGDGQPERRFLYGPTVLEVGLGQPGRLTGAAAQTFEHLVDDFNAPKPSAFASPNGEDFLLNTGAATRIPIDSAFGARFQHVYRAGSASPSQPEFRDVLLDLVGLAWVPQQPMTDTALDDLHVLVGLSGVNRGLGPSTGQVNGNPLPGVSGSGLVDRFDCNLLENREVCGGQGQITAEKLLAALPDQPPRTTVVRPGTGYAIQAQNLFTPANAGLTGFNRYLDFPAFNAGIDPYFGRQDVFAFPYDSNFPMLIEYRVGPNTAPPATNRFRMAPAILSANLPRFRVWSQGQDPLAGGAPNYTQGLVNANDFRAGEGGPLLDPGRVTVPVPPPVPNNGMPTIPVPPAGYETDVTLQPEPDAMPGAIDGTTGCVTALPTPNSDPHVNFYVADGMIQRPLPNTTAYPGPAGQPPTRWTGYGISPLAAGPAAGGCLLDPALAGSNTPGITAHEPGFAPRPDLYGDNSRYFMMWKYRKRVSRIESPTLPGVPGPAGLRWLRPVVDPPPAAVTPGANRRVELRAGGTLDFSNATLDTGWVDGLADDFGERIEQAGSFPTWVKFRASFGVGPGQLQPPSIETIALPYEKLRD